MQAACRPKWEAFQKFSLFLCAWRADRRTDARICAWRTVKPISDRKGGRSAGRSLCNLVQSQGACMRSVGSLHPLALFGCTSRYIISVRRLPHSSWKIPVWKSNQRRMDGESCALDVMFSKGSRHILSLSIKVNCSPNLSPHFYSSYRGNCLHVFSTRISRAGCRAGSLM